MQGVIEYRGKLRLACSLPFLDFYSRYSTSFDLLHSAKILLHLIAFIPSVGLRLLVPNKNLLH